MKIQTTTTPSVTLKTGLNKGHARIWIEGNRLSSNGFPWGTILYRCEIPTLGGSKMILSTIPFVGGSRKHRVAGTPQRPIVDLCGKWVTTFLDGAERYTVTFEGTDLVITPMRGVTVPEGQ